MMKLLIMARTIYAYWFLQGIDIYDAIGRLTKRTWARGIDTTYTYDDWGALTCTDYSDTTPSVVLAYDDLGRQIESHDAAGVTTFVYDAFGSLTNETVVSNRDATNNWGSGIPWRGVASRRRLSAPFNVTNTIERFYDDFGRDAGYALNGIRQSTLAYDPSTGRLASMQIFSEESNHHSSTSTSHFNYYIWDPTEPVATRPLVRNSSTVQPFNSSTFFYTHDGNKNVSEVVASDGALAAHYEYAPFGAPTLSRGTSAATNPWRFSSEYAEDDTATVYYNYRHYEPVTGRWLQRDLIFEKGGISLYCNSKNRVLNFIDYFENNDMYSRWTLQNAGHFLYSNDEHVYAYLKCCQEAIVVHGDKGSAQPSVVGVFKTDCPIK